MLNKLFIDKYDIGSKEKFLRSIARYLIEKGISQNGNDLYDEFQIREKAGNTLISEYVAMPHIESDLVKKTTIAFVNLNNDHIKWDEQHNVKFVIILCISRDESTKVLQEIKKIMIKLADESVEKQLMRCNNLADVREII